MLCEGSYEYLQHVALGPSFLSWTGGTFFQNFRGQADTGISVSVISRFMPRKHVKFSEEGGVSVLFTLVSTHRIQPMGTSLGSLENRIRKLLCSSWVLSPAVTEVRDTTSL